MASIIQNNREIISIGYEVLDTTDSFTCSFKEFIPFCAALYYYSSYKNFNYRCLIGQR